MHKTIHHGRRASSNEVYEQRKILNMLEEPTARKLGGGKKGDSRNTNGISHIYGRRSESVTSNNQTTYKRLQPFRQPNFTPKIYSIAFKSDNDSRRPTLRRMSKQNVIPTYNNNSSQLSKEIINFQKISQQTVEKLKEDLKAKDSEIQKLNFTIKSIDDQLHPLSYSINSLNAFITEYQQLQESHISLNKEIKQLNCKCNEAEQQLKFYESMEQGKRQKLHKKQKQNNAKKTTFEKVESLLSNLNIFLYQLNDLICCQEFYHCVLSVKVEKEAVEIANQNESKRNAVSHYSSNSSHKEEPEDASKQRVDIDEQTLEYLKKSADEQVDSVKNGYGEMRDCWKLYYSFMKSFLEIYAGDSEYADSDN